MYICSYVFILKPPKAELYTIIASVSAYPCLVCLAADFRRTNDVSVGQRKAFWEIVFLYGAAAEPRDVWYKPLWTAATFVYCEICFHESIYCPCSSGIEPSRKY